MLGKRSLAAYAQNVPVPDYQEKRRKQYNLPVPKTFDSLAEFTKTFQEYCHDLKIFFYEQMQRQFVYSGRIQDVVHFLEGQFAATYPQFYTRRYIAPHTESFLGQCAKFLEFFKAGASEYSLIDICNFMDVFITNTLAHYLSMRPIIRGNTDPMIPRISEIFGALVVVEKEVHRVCAKLGAVLQELFPDIFESCEEYYLRTHTQEINKNEEDYKNEILTFVVAKLEDWLKTCIISVNETFTIEDRDIFSEDNFSQDEKWGLIWLHTAAMCNSHSIGMTCFYNLENSSQLIKKIKTECEGGNQRAKNYLGPLIAACALGIVTNKRCTKTVLLFGDLWLSVIDMDNLSGIFDYVAPIIGQIIINHRRKGWEYLEDEIVTIHKAVVP